MYLYSIRGKKLGQTCYLLVIENDGILIDCGLDFSILEDFLREKKINLRGAFLTHGHFDHCIEGALIQSKGYKIYGSEFSDEMTLGTNNLAYYFKLPYKEFSVDYRLKDGEQLKIGDFDITAYHTPGHSSDGMCYLINGVLFSGDTLLSGGYGRYDLPTASKDDLVNSLKRMLKLDKKLPVCSGHEHAKSGVNAFYPTRTIGDYCCSQDIIYLIYA